MPYEGGVQRYSEKYQTLWFNSMRLPTQEDIVAKAPQKRGASKPRAGDKYFHLLLVPDSPIRERLQASAPNLNQKNELKTRISQGPKSVCHTP